MDTSNLSVPFCRPDELASRLGRADAPLLLDVRPDKKFLDSKYLMAGAQRCAPGMVAEFAASQSPREVVVYCVYGHHVSAGAAATLRAAGWNARAVAGGMEGGEDGVDAAKDIAQWRVQRPPVIAKRPDLGVTGERPSKWITRERPKIDRVACPWLVRRFIDTRAEFFYVPTAEVMSQAKRLGAVAYDIPGAPISHEGDRCSFHVLMAAFGLQDAALDRLARIVRGADTDQHGLAPEAAGLLALSLGLSQLHKDDHAMLEAAMPLYDALYAWCQSVVAAGWQGKPAETHNWRSVEPVQAGVV
ncbi:MAG TPA: chromate resistance protein ChrB domain-containing protein [Polaromonas sp.]|uniref:chromate resistance protein ChrB domain-containing protein n=1 Tax=Polaromonas sp. TaxID=1869339 RepID=UPI002D5A197A|nr:chromate resistance protein ChrB domain-containing protein [Polaromonas sp.]HYW55487.1 chromate resistance protein ChrB domain-containing protein [Polaromonas sp.]